jgi:hypothetical protein
MNDFKEQYANSIHAQLSRRKRIRITLANVNNVSRWQLEQYLLGRGFAVYDDESTTMLRDAVKIDLAEQGA